MPLDPQQVSATRDRLGPVGAWLGALLVAPIDEVRTAATRVETLGYRSLWTGEGVSGREAFAFQGVLLAATSTLITGTGIANLWARQPWAMVGAADALGEAYPGRFVLGVGVSHAPMIETRGLEYRHPLERTRQYLEAMGAAEQAAQVSGTDGSNAPVPWVVAALGPRMLELAATRADGAHPYFVPVEHTQLARAALGPDKLLIPEQAVVVEADPGTARAMARHHMENYLLLPNYVNNLRRLGYGDDDLAGPSDRLVDAIVAWGSPKAVAARIAAHLEAGADHVVLQPLGDLAASVAQLEALVSALPR